MPKPRLAASVPATDWNTRSDRRAALDDRQRVGDMGQDAGLGRDLVVLAHLVQHRGEGDRGLDVVGGRVDADDRVASAVEQPVDDRGGHPARVVGRMVGLQAGREPPRQADGGTEGRRHPAFARHDDKILEAHQLRDGGDHLRREARREGGEGRRVGVGPEQPIAKTRPQSEWETGAKAAASWLSMMRRVTSSSS